MSRLQQIKFYYGHQQFRVPVKTALVELSKRSSLYVRATFEGQLLWAECSAFETDWYEQETWQQVYQQLKQYRHQLEQIDINSNWYAQLCEVLTLNHARDTMDYLMWQAYAIQQQQSLVQLLSQQTKIMCGMTVSTNDKQQFQQLIPEMKKYARVKLKWHQDIMDFISYVPNDVMLAIDANRQLTTNDFATLERLAHNKIAYLEEPFMDLATYEKFKRSGISLPIAIDESATSIDNIQSFINHGLADIVCLKHGRLGGLSAIKQLLSQITVPSFAGGMYEVSHSQYVTALVQSMLNSPYPADLVRHYFVKQQPVEVASEYDLQQPILFNPHQLIEL